MNGVIVALATPPGRGALGIVRLCGGGSLALARALTGGKELPPRRPVLRAVFDGEELLDRVLATHYPADGSPVGEETVELCAHGSPYVLERLLALCRAAGARDALPGEFTRRAYLSGRLELSQAEAVADLIAARTRLAHRGARARLEGGLAREVESLRAGIIDALAPVEAAIDHPDDDLPAFAPDTLRALLARVRTRLERAEACARRGRLLGGELRAAIVGLPNAGKSSLLNALLGRPRAIVSPSPGTTRDTLEAPCDLEGLGALLVDTAGLRGTTEGPLEAEGVRRAEAELAGCDAALVVVDRTADPDAQRALLERAARGRPAVAALNKCDLPPGLRPVDLRAWAPGVPVVEVSALHREGLPELARALRAAALPPQEAPEDWAFGLGSRHADAFARARAALEEADALCGEPELAAERLHEALGTLDEVAGRTTREDVLSAVFSRFCVGK